MTGYGFGGRTASGTIACLSVSCPLCGAAPGRLCVGPFGESMRTAHIGRQRRYAYRTRHARRRKV